MKNKSTAIIVKLLSLLLGMVGIMMLLPFLWAWFTHETACATRPVFGGLALLGILIGLSSRYMRKVWRHTAAFRVRDGFLTVVLAWLVMAVFSALPYYLTGLTDSFSDAFYESVSGFTTTGSSVFQDPSVLPESVLLWRALTQWIGGLGIIIFMIAALPAMGLAGYALFAAEMTGSMDHRSQPRLKDTAKIICAVYIILTFAETILLGLAGMSFHDACCHALSTVATGGFSTYPDSLVSASPLVQYIVLLFMFLSGINYMMYYFMIKKQFTRVARDEELRVYGIYMLALCLLASVALYLSTSGKLEAEEAFRLAAFQCVSIGTTTGFVSSDFSLWPAGLQWVLLSLMVVGACSGSSTGAMKLSRFVLMFKNTLLEFKRAAHPRAVLPLKYNGRVLGQEVIRQVLAFFFLYVLVGMVGAVCFAFCGFDLVTSFAISFSSMSNIGPVTGQVCSLCAVTDYPAIAKWLSMWLMLVGRLGLFTVLLIGMPSFWKNK